MSDIALVPFEKPVQATLAPPGSKSLTNRALVLAALAKGQSTIRNILLADDTRVMLDSLKRLGFELSEDQAGRSVTITGTDGDVPARGAELFCGNSGTTIRFLLALCSLGRGDFVLDGVARMRERPIEELGELLKHVGVRLSYPVRQGYPPVHVHADRLPGGRLYFGPAKSSQFLSAVLQVAPFAKHELRVDLGWPQTSWPYIAMTMRLMDEFGQTPELVREAETGRPLRILVPAGSYNGREYVVEPDASNASYFLAMAAIREGAKVTIEHLGKHSLQGDVGFADLLHRMGADMVFGRDFITVSGTGKLSGIDVSMADMPDMAQTLGVVALFAEGPTIMRGLHTLRVKETDRVAALATELQKLGATVEVEGGEDVVMTIHPPAKIAEARIATYDDHRMAMSFAVAGTRIPGVTICDCQCVNKTYPQFWDDLQKLAAASG